MEIGQRLRELREQRGWTQGDVERATGMFRAHISRIELGYMVPSLETIERFAAVLDVPVYEIFRDASTAGDTTVDDSPLIDLLAGHVRKMKPDDRDFLLSVAEHLASRESLAKGPG